MFHVLKLGVPLSNGDRIHGELGIADHQATAQARYASYGAHRVLLMSLRLRMRGMRRTHRLASSDSLPRLVSKVMED